MKNWQTYYQYGWPMYSTRIPNGQLYIDKTSRNQRINRTFDSQCYGFVGPLHGYFGGVRERIDTILQKTENITVRSNKEKVDGSLCYVIDAVDKTGEYHIWLDPEHDYHIAKAIVKRGPDDQWYIGENLTNKSLYYLMENINFKKINGVWVPMRMDTVVKEQYTDKLVYESSAHCERKEVVLNPDHNSLDSFVPNDVRNGAETHLIGIDTITCTWQDGKVIDKNGKIIMDCRPDNPGDNPRPQSKSASKEKSK